VHRTQTAVCVLAAMALTGVAACGDDNGDSSSTSALTKQEFIAQADAICKKGNQTVDKEGQKFFSQKGADPEQFVNKVFVPTIQSELDDVGALMPPAGDEDEVQNLLDAAQQALDKVKQDPALFEQGQGPFKEANQLAADYGLKECGGG
jgi:hypothetical protein